MGTRFTTYFEDFVHIDDKWFNVCQNGQRYYLYTDEELPTRKVQHESHITTVPLCEGMFLEPHVDLKNCL